MRQIKMDTAKADAQNPPKLPDMIMCGDHPSFTAAKTDLNAKEKPEEKKRPPMSHTRLSPSVSASSRTERERERSPERTERRPANDRLSEHALRLLEARRRGRSIELMPRTELDVSAPGNRALVHAALGSFRWPPYLLAVWVVVLVVTHLLHCVVTMMERALPTLKKCCTYFRTWTEECWKVETDNINQRIYPIALALITGLLYALYFATYVIYSVALWSIEPLCSELDDKLSNAEMEPKVTNYVDEVSSKSTLKH